MTQSESKPVVKYCLPPFVLSKPKVGFRAWVVPLNHPQRSLNGELAHTSTVISADGSGDFETLNTKYVLEESKELDLQQQFIVK